jgi:hypothetical protein
VPDVTAGTRQQRHDAGWIGNVLAAQVTVWTHFTDAGQVTQFFTALLGVAFTATVMGRTLGQITGRLSPNAVGMRMPFFEYDDSNAYAGREPVTPPPW